MAGNFKVGMTLTAKDEASQVLEKGKKKVVKATEGVEKATKKAGQEQKRTDDESINSTKRVVTELQRAARARETLGIRSEHEIRREIALTEASYNRLARSGVMSAREQARAWRATKEQIRELKREMRGVGTLAKAANIGGNVLTIGGGIAAGTAIMTQPVKKQMSFDRRLSEMANTAFSDGGLAGRQAGKEKLKSSIKNAVMYGGGSKEDAADTMNELLAAGVDYDTADKWLPQIMKYATASGALPKELATIAVSLRDTFNVSDKDIPVALNMAIAAGKEGRVELKDMAEALPGQLGIAQKTGMWGLDGFQKILTANEAAGITAGNGKEAANNTLNFLDKINSKQAADAAANIKMANGKYIDLPGTMTMARERGIDPIEAFNRVLDAVVKNNPAYQELQKKLAASKDKKEQAEILDSMATILEGFGVGEILQDRQALLGALAYRQNPEFRKKVEAEIEKQRSLPEGQRTGDVDFEFTSGTNDFKTEQAKNTLEFSQMDSVKKLADASGAVADAISWAGEKFPGLTTAVVAATTAIEAMTAAALTWAGVKILTGGKSGGKIGDVVGDVLETTIKKGKGLKLPGIAGGLLSFGGTVTALATATSPEEDAAVEGSEERWKNIRAKYPQWLIDAAREKYQPWWQFGEGYSTENEKWIQQYLDELKKTGVIAGDSLPTPEQVRQQAGMTAADTINASGKRGGQPGVQNGGQPPAPPVNVTTQVVLDGQVIAEAVNKYNLQDGNRGTGGTY
ncbi:TPA: tail length tape measure protein [Escherichia coli]|uniref:phage tail tape measure protein n=2 Tax=Escherichia coli TaxID=562 RepID=UPI00050953D1|nr:phage tail tape measure protein [Escherichia coli]EJX1049640.1 phage tail tape measure protein [Escherichia coli]EJX1078510.1 phage tail tape measure protein [Escherichia coli]EJX1083265.1 phage tail tape measure protein [Escherichia coli]EKR9849609.1 phage tail tape measure protein [Escherichia coli]MDM4965354.1 phage tail tape measure protein [Escherichia coli]